MPFQLSESKKGTARTSRITTFFPKDVFVLEGDARPTAITLLKTVDVVLLGMRMKLSSGIDDDSEGCYQLVMLDSMVGWLDENCLIV